MATRIKPPLGLDNAWWWQMAKEGTRVTSQLVGCQPQDVDFCLPVEMHIQRDPDGFALPVFSLAGSA